MEQEDKNFILEKLRKKDYKARTKDMGRLQKFIYDHTPRAKVDYKVPLSDRSLDQIVNLKSLDL